MLVELCSLVPTDVTAVTGCLVKATFFSCVNGVSAGGVCTKIEAFRIRRNDLGRFLRGRTTGFPATSVEVDSALFLIDIEWLESTDLARCNAFLCSLLPPPEYLLNIFSNMFLYSKNNQSINQSIPQNYYFFIITIIKENICSINIKINYFTTKYIIKSYFIRLLYALSNSIIFRNISKRN